MANYVHIGNENYQGLSTDTKPTNVPSNATAYETDTYTTYKADGSGGWKELSPQIENDYTIFKSGTTYKAKNGSTGVVDITNTNTDIGQLLNDVITAMPNGGKIFIKPATYNIITPVSLPVLDVGLSKQYMFVGIPPSARQTCTTIQTASTFPNQRYMFEAIATIGSNKTSTFIIDGLFLYNSFARSGTGGQNIQGPGNSTIIDAGFLKFASDHTTGVPMILRNITTQYLWRGIHLLGYQFFGKVDNYFAQDFNINILTDCHIIMERGGYPDNPKAIDFNHITLNSQAGASSGTGSVNMAMCIGGAYHNIRNVYVDGSKYNEALIAFKQCWSTQAYGIGTIDMVNPQGAGFKGTFLFDTLDFSGTAASHSPNEWTCYNNQIYDIYGSPLPYSLAFYNGAYRNRIKMYAYWGGNMTIDDAGAGIENVVELIEGQQPSGIANGKISSTSGLVKIVDSRMGSNKRGIATFSGNDSTKVFNIAHGLFTTPATYNVERISTDSQGAIDVTVTSTNIVVTYKGFAPTTGTNNIKLAWYADVY